MQKVKLFFFILILTPLICAVFGIIHDQITYTISPEYFTKFKFVQFGLIEEGMHLGISDRLAVLIVGIMATWWVGVPIGLMYAVILVSFKDKTGPYKLYFKTTVLTFVLTILTSFAGYLNWKFHLQYTAAPDWYYPENLIDKNHFICVGSIHNFSYLGGGIGAIAGIIYLIIQKGKENFSKRDFNIRK